MVDKRTLLRPSGGGLVSTLVDEGIAVICPDLRGHGTSGPMASEGGRWSYDDLVDFDVPALVGLARRRFPTLPLVAVGHSLFGHVTVAHLAKHNPRAVDGVALLACNVGSRSWLGLPLSDALGSSLIALMAASTLPFGRFPTRLLGLGNTDEAQPYIFDFVRWVQRNDWVARDGFSYRDACARIQIPVAAWVGAGDRLFSRPAAAEAFLQWIDPTKRARVVGRHTGLSFDPGHMELATDRRCEAVWREVGRFVRTVGAGRPPG